MFPAIYPYNGYGGEIVSTSSLFDCRHQIWRLYHLPYLHLLNVERYILLSETLEILWIGNSARFFATIGCWHKASHVLLSNSCALYRSSSFSFFGTSNTSIKDNLESKFVRHASDSWPGRLLIQGHHHLRDHRAHLQMLRAHNRC